MGIPTPNYVLMEAFSSISTSREYITLEAGAFVRPIELKYVPKHVIDDHRWKLFNKKIEVFCFTHYGIIPVPSRLLRQV